MYKKFIILAMFTLLFIVTACSSQTVQEENPNKLDVSPYEDTIHEKIKVVTTLFPQYDFTNKIGGDFVEVSLLLPPGVEPHSFEPSPGDIIKIENSDLFIFTGEYMEPWALRIAGNIQSQNVYILDISSNIILLDEEHYGCGHDHSHNHNHEKDPHIWLDPINAKIMVDNILESLISIDPDNRDFYLENAINYKNKLDKLHESFLATFENTSSNTIISGGHFAFGYFIERYNLNHISPYDGFSPNAEPSPRRIIELIEKIKETGAEAIFYEELIDPKVAKLLRDETGSQLLLLHGAHNLSRDEINSNLTYLDIMYNNLDNLKIGLGYNE